MADRVPARLTAAAGRTFGLTVGLAFVVLGGIAWWRGRYTAATVLLSLGGALGLAGLIVPTLLGPVERTWMRLAHLISKVTTPIFMGVVYFVAITPIGFIRRLAGSPIRARERAATRWEPHTAAVDERERMEHQF